MNKYNLGDRIIIRVDDFGFPSIQGQSLAGSRIIGIRKNSFNSNIIMYLITFFAKDLHCRLTETKIAHIKGNYINNIHAYINCQAHWFCDNDIANMVNI